MVRALFALDWWSTGWHCRCARPQPQAHGARVHTAGQQRCAACRTSCGDRDSHVGWLPGHTSACIAVRPVTSHSIVCCDCCKPAVGVQGCALSRVRAPTATEVLLVAVTCRSHACSDSFQPAALVCRATRLPLSAQAASIVTATCLDVSHTATAFTVSAAIKPSWLACSFARIVVSAWDRPWPCVVCLCLGGF